MRVDALAETVRWLSLTERPGETADTLRCRDAMFPARDPGPCIAPGDGAASSALACCLRLHRGRRSFNLGMNVSVLMWSCDGQCDLRGSCLEESA